MSVISDIKKGVSDGLASVEDFVVNAFETASGEKAADAAKEAADIQAEAALSQAEATKESTAMVVAEQEAARKQARADLAPFVQFGQQGMAGANRAIQASQQLFNDPMAIMQNPMFAAIMEDNQRNIMQNAAVRGRLGTGGTAEALQNAALRTGFDILNNERNAMLNNARFMTDIVGMGQSAAAGQGATSMQAGSNIASSLMAGQNAQTNLITGAANAQAAGTVSAANAQQQGFMNLVNLGASIYGMS